MRSSPDHWTLVLTEMNSGDSQTALGVVDAQRPGTRLVIFRTGWGQFRPSGWGQF